jgi:transposase-like protein
MSGHPTKYTPELGRKICAMLADGMTLRAIADTEGMPARSTMAEWRKKFPDFRAAETQARQDHADALADEIVHIADTEKDPQKARNMIEARKWLSGVIKPRTYGPRVDLTVTPNLDPRALHDEGQQRVRVMRDGTSAYLIPQIIKGETVHVPEDEALSEGEQPSSIFD